ncbi:ubiquinol-cytochrome C chaperone-domain-containing protein [Hysterangium stoloniferum]|nr:ubiquinol-cytochrome C chaperone-domain-containing protein [Hysterangium stoloniferum]
MATTVTVKPLVRHALRRGTTGGQYRFTSSSTSTLPHKSHTGPLASVKKSNTGSTTEGIRPEPSTSQVTPDQPFPAPYFHKDPAPLPRSAVTRWILASPTRTNALLKLGDLFGYGSPKQVAGRRALLIYEICRDVSSGPEKSFWYDSLSLPPTFQSWFTVTNLHIWMATVRLRALPPSHGRPFVQALIDHFFLDVEDRLRAVLGKKAPERLVVRHMKIFREQWAGLGLACDVALITGDKDMSSAMWRNLLGARGARGIAYPDFFPQSPSYDPSRPPAIQPEDPKRENKNDPATGGVVDFEGPEIDKYIVYPQLMLSLTSYVRRELVRLEGISDITILGGRGQGMRDVMYGPSEDIEGEANLNLKEVWKFGSVKVAAKKVGLEWLGSAKDAPTDWEKGGVSDQEK